MSQTTAQDRLRAQIAAVRQGLGDTVPPAAANDSDHTVTYIMPAQPHNRQPEFKFFHRKKVPEGTTTSARGAADDAASTRAALETLQGRVQHLEGAIALHRRYTLELNSLLSQIDTKTLRTAGKAIRRVRARQQFLFWLVIGLLGLGWVGLTPAGHEIINYLLALI